MQSRRNNKYYLWSKSNKKYQLQSQRNIKYYLQREREEYQQQNERIVFIINLVANLEYYYALQQQELEGDEIDSLGKRKVHSYHKDELYINKKQQHTFVSSQSYIMSRYLDSFSFLLSCKDWLIVLLLIIVYIYDRAFHYLSF